MNTHKTVIRTYPGARHPIQRAPCDPSLATKLCDQTADRLAHAVGLLVASQTSDPVAWSLRSAQRDQAAQELLAVAQLVTLAHKQLTGWVS